MTIDEAVEGAYAAMVRGRVYFELVLQGDTPEEARAWVEKMYIFKPLKSDIAGVRAAIAAFLRAAEATKTMCSEGESAASIGIGTPNDEEAIKRVWIAMATKAADEVEGGGR